ncbi:hypothetical protein [Cohnella thailandensis]|uniref:Uncharacterized protein n=1 Tax=Cohnella thailandensis TaxID=557557 RepID=A0A841SST4_9BACL|nr:hypothetical protein [Cohnella thailandensis]MBB6633115.1 hypothetical protein [Cohnella thailandensis]MBP1975190.1 hypothetical protein [Cohnella thailandensis]
MNESTVVRWLGMICLLAGIARIGMTPTSFIWGTDSMPELVFGYIACILMSVGTIAIYQVQSKETGVTGFISTLGIIIGNVVTTALLFTTFVMDPSGPKPEGTVVVISGMINMIGLTGGTVLFTILTYRAKVFPRWIVLLNVLMILSMFLPIADNKLFAMFWGLTYVGMGYCIWTGKLNSRTEKESAEFQKPISA